MKYLNLEDAQKLLVRWYGTPWHDDPYEMCEEFLRWLYEHNIEMVKDRDIPIEKIKMAVKKVKESK